MVPILSPKNGQTLKGHKNISDNDKWFISIMLNPYLAGT